MNINSALLLLTLPILTTALLNACGKRTFYNSTDCEKPKENLLIIGFKSKKGNTRTLELDTSRKMLLLTQSIHEDAQWAVEFKQVKRFEVHESRIFSVELKNSDNFNFGTVDSRCLDEIKSHLDSIVPLMDETKS